MSDIDSPDRTRPSHTITIVGAGTMGHGIAMAFALGGRSVVLYDTDIEALQAAQNDIQNAVSTLLEHGSSELYDDSEVLDAIKYERSFPVAVSQADLVIEAVPEDFETKIGVLAQIDRHAPSDAIFASNTSSFSITELGDTIADPTRFVGTHWFHPPHIVPVVEVVQGKESGEDVVAVVYELLEEIEKTPVLVKKDIPGFIGNRIQSAMAHEAWSLLNEGVASAEDIDKAVKGTFGFRLPALGVFEKGDHSGLDIHAKVLDQLLGEINRDTTPSRVLTRLVENGHRGVKTEKGVYDWGEVDISEATNERDYQLLSLLAVYQQRENPALRWNG
ncbi:3-hydroxyacyl-CoA dehydrogenase family protein (plasmid) [Haloferacaceae archaeon DSL9]